MERLFSIIIPIYNVERYIARCLESVLNQSYDNFEVILINDGSDDNSYEICKKYMENDNRITLISQDNKGVSSARNLGLQSATGKYVLFLDGDDAIMPSLCSKLKCIIEQSESNELIIFGYCNINDKVKQEIGVKDELIFYKENMGEMLFELDKLKLLYTVWNKVFLRSRIQNGFSEEMTFAEDSCFIINYLEQIEKIRVIPFIGYQYYTNISGSAMKKYHKDMFEICLKEYKCIIESKIDYHERLLSFAQYHLRKNFWYFVLPALLRTVDLNKKEKRNELKIIVSLQEYKQLKILHYAECKMQLLFAFLVKIKCLRSGIYIYEKKLNSSWWCFNEKK